jgi:hypothetical protein
MAQACAPSLSFSVEDDKQSNIAESEGSRKHDARLHERVGLVKKGERTSLACVLRASFLLVLARCSPWDSRVFQWDNNPRRYVPC